MLRAVRFLPLLLIVLFVAWCSTSNEHRRNQMPLRRELTGLFYSQGLTASLNTRNGDLDEAARRAGPSGMNQVLHAAAPNATVDALRWLIEHGADPARAGAPGGVPLLHAAMREPNVARLEFFFGLGLDPRQRGPGGGTLMHAAAAAGLNDPVLRLLLSKGLTLADVDQAGQLPIHVSHPRSLDVLVRAGADVNAVDALGRTALHRAASSGRVDLVNELLRLGASVFRTDAEGRTPLHLATLARSTAVVDLLLAAGAPRSARDHEGRTAHDLAQPAPSPDRGYRGFAGRR